MPDRKKPTRAPAKRTTTTRAPAKPASAARKPASAARRAATTTRKPAATKKPSAARGKRAASDELEPLDLDGLELEDDEPEETPPARKRAASRAVATEEIDADGAYDDDDAGEPPFSTVAIAAGPFVDDEGSAGVPQVIHFGESPVDHSSEDEPLGLERPREELLVGVAAVLLGASVFLPWFGQGQFTISGWAGGLWGPVIAFLCLAVVATVVLRRLKVPIAFPIDHAAIFEVVGWLAVVGLVASRFFGVEVDGAEHAAQKIIFLPIVLAAALAMLAGRVSSGSPFVVRPGWHRGTAGKVGVLVLALAVAGGAGFGMTGTPVRQIGVGNPRGATKTFRGVLPPCAKEAKFPSPVGVKYQLSFQLENGLCQVTFSSTLSIAKLTSLYKAALKTSGWSYTAVPAPGSITFQLRKPRCGALSISEPPTGTTPKSKTRTGIAFFQKQCISPQQGGEPQN